MKIFKLHLQEHDQIKFKYSFRLKKRFSITSLHVLIFNSMIYIQLNKYYMYSKGYINFINHKNKNYKYVNSFKDNIRPKDKIKFEELLIRCLL